MHSLRLLVLLGVLMATQGRVLDQDTAPEVVASPQETKPVEVKQEVANEILETQPQLGGAVISQGQSSAAIDQVGVKEGQDQVTNSTDPDVQESQPQVVSVLEVTKENQEAHAPLTKVVSSPVAPAITEEKQSTSNEIPKDQEPRKEEVITQNHPNVQGRDNKIQLVYEQPGQNQNQIPQISIQDLEKIFKYQGVQVVNGSQPLYQYPSTYNKYPSYPKVEYVSVVNTSDANKQQQKQQSQQQPAQKPNFYLIPNPLASQASGDGQKVDGNVVLPINLAALPLLVPAPELTQGKASPSGSISFQDLIKATNVHVSQPIKLQANNGFTQVQKEQAAIQQLILSHLSEQQKLFQKQSVAGGKRSQSAQPVVQLQEEEESSVLFAVEIPKPIYRFFKGIFGGFSN
ncbi:GD13639 [Drosophila simulans]|uniref:GD13639 n=1 Tax=Drosophila simulans TaxID=7240 RepID=B4QMI9_DROSI|nr:GD13639 [Drosophila simulans]